MPARWIHYRLVTKVEKRRQRASGKPRRGISSIAKLCMYSLRLKQSKYLFLQSSMEYCLDDTGVNASPKKVEAICQNPLLTNITELRS